MPRNIDTLDPLQPKVPLELRKHESGDEAAAGRIDMNGDIPPRLLVQDFQLVVKLLHVVELPRVRVAQNGHHADGVLVAQRDGLVDVQHPALFGDRDPVLFHTEVAAELVPADMRRLAKNQVGRYVFFPGFDFPAVDKVTGDAGRRGLAIDKGLLSVKRVLIVLIKL